MDNTKQVCDGVREDTSMKKQENKKNVYETHTHTSESLRKKRSTLWNGTERSTKVKKLNAFVGCNV